MQGDQCGAHWKDAHLTVVIDLRDGAAQCVCRSEVGAVGLLHEWRRRNLCNHLHQASSAKLALILLGSKAWLRALHPRCPVTGTHQVGMQAAPSSWADCQRKVNHAA